MAGRPAAPVNISPNVLQVAQLSGIVLTPRELYAVIANKLEWLQWLARHRFRNNVQCGTCMRPMALVASYIARYYCVVTVTTNNLPLVLSVVF